MTSFTWRHPQAGQELDGAAYESALATILGPEPDKVYDGEEVLRSDNADSLVELEDLPLEDVESVIEFTAFFELPFDLGIPSDKCFSFIEERQDRFGRWAEDIQRRVAGVGCSQPKAGPIDRLVIRRGRIRERLPIVAVDRTFGDWLAPYLSAQTLQHRHQAIQEYEDRGLPVVRTVVAYTQWFDAEVWPTAEREWSAFCAEHVDFGIVTINRLIVATALMAQNPELRPLNTGDFPAALPFIAAAIKPTGEKALATGLLPVNDLVQWNAGVMSAEEFIGVHRVISELSRNETAFAAYFEAFVRSMNALKRHQWTETVVNVATAVEVFAYTVVRETSIAQKMSTETVDRLLQCGFTNISRDHLPNAFATKQAPVKAAVERWLAGGYETRNRCIHEGQRATAEMANSAYADAANLFGSTYEALRKDGFNEIADDFGLRFETS